MVRQDEPLSNQMSSSDGLKHHYQAKKHEYLELCWNYNLPPRDMSLLLMGNREIEAEDRIRLIRLIIQLMDMEKRLSPEVVKDYLFAEDESRCRNSAVFAANLH